MVLLENHSLEVFPSFLRSKRSRSGGSSREAGVALGAKDLVTRIRRAMRGDEKEQPGVRRLKGVPS